jgi:hypothetical protein
MTYNFDPDAWYARELALVEERYQQGELDDDAYAESLDRLERRFEEMLDRLDGSYRIPGGGG